MTGNTRADQRAWRAVAWWRRTAATTSTRASDVAVMTPPHRHGRLVAWIDRRLQRQGNDRQAAQAPIASAFIGRG
jgi:hypothetical protein